MELHCLRHGRTIGNVRGHYQGACDSELADEQVASLLDVTFDSSGYDAVYCSPRSRCTATAKALGIAQWLEEPRIAERHFGIFEGLSGEECASRFPSEFQAFQRFDADYQIPDGESRAQNLRRVLEWLEDAKSHQRVLAITHGGTIDFLYRISAGLHLHGGDRIFSASNASVSSFLVRWPEIVLIDYDGRLQDFVRQEER